MTTFASLIITNHQIAIALNFESFNIRLLNVIIIMLSKTEFKTQYDNKRALNFESDHFSFSLNLNLIINSFARGKRLKHINILSDQSIFKSKSSNQSIFKPRSFISLMTFILSLLFILSGQSTSKSRSFTFFIFIDII